LHMLPASHYQPDGQSGSQPLCERHDIGRDSPVLAGKHLAGAPYSRLHFIEYEQDAMPVTQIAQALQKAVRWHEIAALALDGLDQDGRHLAGRYVAREEHVLDVVEHRTALIDARKQRTVEVGIRNVSHTRHGRKEAGLLSIFAGRKCERAHGAPMKATEKPD